MRVDSKPSQTVQTVERLNADLAGDPILMLQALESRAQLRNREALSAVRDCAYQARISAIRQSIEEARAAARLNLASGLFKGALTLAQGVCAMAGPAALHNGKELAAQGQKLAAQQAIALGKRLQATGNLLGLAKEVMVTANAEPMQLVAQKRDIDGREKQLQADQDKRYEDDFRDAAQNARQAAQQGLQRLEKLADLRHQSRMLAIGRV